ncbi:MAG: aspartyl protease [Methanobacteriota archaeon]|nr:MAG: aspartyl protease [Euryarchaeota archaeon]
MAAQTMGEVRVPVTFRGPKGAATVEDVLVDTGATHTAVESGLAEALGLVPRWRHPFETANGPRDFDIALAEVEILGRSMPMSVVIADVNLVGMTTLESLGFKVDPVQRRLEPTVGVLYSVADPETTTPIGVDPSGLIEP